MRFYYINHLLKRYEDIKASNKKDVEIIEQLRLEVAKIIHNLKEVENKKDVNFVEILEYIENKILQLKNKTLKKLSKKEVI
ncbi:hypothetical protein N5T62_05435 [Aliarcobacter cryaerophilus]|uniref:hypothetical protein n=1 Tax=Aliarcobacter cryaerophilus TaxID=28198 RepID=UPI0021B1DEF9|nr:hypothetical protein [Aliarcobacter cryaerophilus]MCT7505519.1 hypothetical protein [Aliarcobacter cryaerophilus]